MSATIVTLAGSKANSLVAMLSSVAGPAGAAVPPPSSLEAITKATNDTAKATTAITVTTASQADWPGPNNNSLLVSSVTGGAVVSAVESSVGSSVTVTVLLRGSGT